MRSIFFPSCFHSKVIKFFSVTPSAYQSPYSTLWQGVTIQCNFRAPRSTLMLGCTCMIHLGIQWTRIWCFRAYSQHQHGRLQGLFPTLPIIFSCVPELLAQQKGKYLCDSELLAQHKSSMTHVLQRFPLNTKHLINHVIQGPRPTQTSIYIYIYHQWLLFPIYKTNHHVHMQLGLWPGKKNKTSR